MKKIFVRFKNGSEARYDQVAYFGYDMKGNFLVIELSNGLRVSVNKDEVLFTEEYSEPENGAESFMNEPVEE